MPSKADTCRNFVVPLLQAAGWDTEPHSIAEQRTITDGRIVSVGTGCIRPPKRVDHLLRYRRDLPSAVGSIGCKVLNMSNEWNVETGTSQSHSAPKTVSA